MTQQYLEKYQSLIDDTTSGKKLSVPLLLAPVCKQRQIGVTRQCTPRLPLNVNVDKGNRVRRTSLHQITRAREAIQPLEIWVVDGCGELEWIVSHY
jgi:hypothetical protein